MSKRIIAVFMLAGMMLSMAACNGTGLIPGMETTSGATTISLPVTSETSESSQETTTEVTEETTSEETTTEETTTEETTSETTSETTTETTKAATPTPNTKYPKVTIKGVSTTVVNKEIAKKFGPITKKNDSVVKYSYYIGKKYVSILVTVNLDAGKDGNEYYAYNISRVTGKKLSKSEMLKLLGVSSSTFNNKVKTGVKNWWSTNILKNDKSSKTKKQYNAAIASKSINSAVPFVNSKGKRCFLLRQMKAPTQFVNNDIYMTF